MVGIYSQLLKKGSACAEELADYGMKFPTVFTFSLGIGMSLLSAGLLEDFRKSSTLRTASVGLCFIPLEGEGGSLEWQADLGLIPASTMKALSTATALELLGPEYCFETKLYLKGDDLVVKGGGDPTLCSTSLTGDFSAWLRALRMAGVREITGDLIMDPSRFESRTTPNEWPWGDVGNYYGAGPSGLNFHKNSFALTFNPGKLWGSARLSKIWPKPPGVKFENEMRTGRAGSGDQGYVYGGPGAQRIWLRGTIPMGGPFTIYGALPDPPKMCGVALRDFLEKEGIGITGKLRVEKALLEDLEPLFVQRSPSLAKIAKGTNHRSVNLYADSIFKSLTPAGSTAGAVVKVRHHWGKMGVDLTGFVMQDGSGLSPRNTVTARQMTRILKLALREGRGRDFRASLPVAGRSGTMLNFGKGTLVEGRVRAKSGSLTRVRSYAGYLEARSGREYAFAIFVNNEIGRSKGAIVQVLSRFIAEH